MTMILDAMDDAATEEDVLVALSRPLENGARQLEYAVPDAYCAACIVTIETALAKLPQVSNARVNLSTRRVRVTYDPAAGHPNAFAPTIERSGYRTFVLDPDADTATDQVLGQLVRAMAVAGFAAGNIMLFSVSVWSGADGATRDLFHWLSALIALPAIAYAGRPFFQSAFAALRVGKTNMDVPIAIGVTLATALSLYETIRSGEHAYFDASTMLLFFLLIGRTLDHLMREKARSAVTNLARLAPRGAMSVLADGTTKFVAIHDIMPGLWLKLRAGERVPVDCRVVDGTGFVDLSVATGESLPQPVSVGSTIIAGAISTSGSLIVEAERAATDSFLARMVSLMEAAEGSKTIYRRIADRAASFYAPVVHVVAISTFLGWGILSGDWHTALLNAVAVLIITCPCALALAVPIVHVIAAGRLFEQGVMMRDGTGLERAAQVTEVVFDKTGTLTRGHMHLHNQVFGAPGTLAVAAGLASHSTHPLSAAIVSASAHPQVFTGTVAEFPGQGVEGISDTGTWRLGSASFCNTTGLLDAAEARTSVWLTQNGQPIAAFTFTDEIRPDAAATIASLEDKHLAVTMLSGDVAPVVASVAEEIGITHYHAAMTPQTKLTEINGKTAAGARLMMVGDGINDAPALRAAHVSMAPSEASDVGRNAADFIFTNGRLSSVDLVLTIARKADRLVRENLVLAIGYNALALPLAVLGHVTPLIAAIAMSSSSIIVVANALRLRLGSAPRPKPATEGNAP